VVVADAGGIACPGRHDEIEGVKWRKRRGRRRRKIA
jgi:hypothetical protein